MVKQQGYDQRQAFITLRQLQLHGVQVKTQVNRMRLQRVAKVREAASKIRPSSNFKVRWRLAERRNQHFHNTMTFYGENGELIAIN